MVRSGLHVPIILYSPAGRLRRFHPTAETSIPALSRATAIVGNTSRRTLGPTIQLANPLGCRLSVREHRSQHPSGGVLEAGEVESHHLRLDEIAEQRESDPDVTVGVAGLVREVPQKVAKDVGIAKHMAVRLHAVS